MADSPPRVTGAKRKLPFRCDEERIVDHVRLRAHLPYRVSPLVAFSSHATNYELQMAAKKLGIDTRGSLDRAELVRAVATLPVSALKALCRVHGISTHRVCEREELLDVVRAKARARHDM